MDKQKETAYKIIIELTTEAYRLKKAFERAINLLDFKEQKKNINKIKWFDNRLKDILDNYELRIVDFEGEIYSSGIPATPINLDDFDSNDELFIKQTIEPTILNKDSQIVQTGSIIVEKA